MNDASSTIAPIQKTLTVRLSPDEAFELFTNELSRWWPLASYSCHGAAAVRVAFEPRVGGAVTEHARDGRNAPWGTVLVWDPPRRFVMTWHPGAPSEQATRVDVSFRREGEELTRVELMHTGWEARGAEADAKRDQYEGGWGVVLAAFAAAARGGFEGAQ